jgi:D-serine deaminase-like pyridoxal phosphate-dependent protein
MGRRRLIGDADDRVRATYRAAIGRRRETLITPALVLDIAAAQRNIDHMADRLRSLPAGIRPHVKAHKSPELARRQVAAGAVGISTATIWEAIVMADAGIDDIFLVNQIVDSQKVKAAAELARNTKLRVAVDAIENARILSAAAVAAGSKLGVMIEVDTGMGRSGVLSAEEAMALARNLLDLPGLRFDGLTGYEGHCSMTPDREQRLEQQRVAMAEFVEIADAMSWGGIPVSVLSAGGTATWEWTAANPRITEIQAGTYVVMDNEYGRMVPGFQHSLTVQSTVISRSPHRVIVDAGSKSICDGERSSIVGSTLRPIRFDEEHGIFDSTDGSNLRVGDSVSLIPGYSPSTVNWYDAYHVVEDDVVVDIWPVIPRGPGHGGLIID